MLTLSRACSGGYYKTTVHILDPTVASKLPLPFLSLRSELAYSPASLGQQSCAHGFRTLDLICALSRMLHTSWITSFRLRPQSLLSVVGEPLTRSRVRCMTLARCHFVWTSGPPFRNAWTTGMRSTSMYLITTLGLSSCTSLDIVIMTPTSKISAQFNLTQARQQ